MLSDWRVAIVKPVGNACLLRCGYCFYNSQEQRKSRVMTFDLLETFTEQFMGLFTGTKHFIWHGGEPMIAGLEFFERAVELQCRYAANGERAVNHIQTNGLLIDDEWARFFKKHGFKVGVSIDGARQSHDRFRKDANGHGSFVRVLRGISFLRKHDLRFGVIMTITRDSLPRLEDDLDFVRAFGVGVATNDYELSSSGDELKEQGIAPADAKEIWSRVLEWWLRADDPNLRVRSIDNIVCGVMRRRPRNCTYNGTCHHYFCLHNDGEIYPCDRLSRDRDLCLGSVELDRLDRILSGPRFERHAERARRRPTECQCCEFLEVCNNGCTALREETSGRYVYCESRRQAFVDIANLCGSARDGALRRLPKADSLQC
jgi:uncharacterized protein